MTRGLTRGLGRLAGRIGSGVFCLVLEIVTGGGGTRFLLSIGATLMIASFALVPKASLLFRPPFFVARFIFLLFVAASCRYGVRNTTVQRLPEGPGELQVAIVLDFLRAA
jgi:hypothetical protein